MHCSTLIGQHAFGQPVDSSWEPPARSCETLGVQGLAVLAMDSFAAERYQDAARQFQEAYRCEPVPVLLYNLARAYQLQGEVLESCAAFEEYLQLTVSSTHEDDSRTRAEDFLEVLCPNRSQRFEASQTATAIGIGVRQRATIAALACTNVCSDRTHEPVAPSFDSITIDNMGRSLGPEFEAFSSHWLDSVETLRLNNCDARCAEALAESQLSRQIRVLGVDECVDQGTLPGLLSQPWPNLTHLSLTGCPDLGADTILPEELNQLGGSMPNLQSITLEFQSLGDVGMVHLAEADLPRLVRLRIEEDCVGQEGLAAVFGSAGLPNLTELELDLECRRDELDADAVIEFLSGIQQLTHLSISGDLRISPEQLRTLSLGSLDSLESLVLSGQTLGSEGAEIVADWAGLGQLHSLQLRHTDLGNEGLVLLAGSPYLSQLRVLNLAENELGPEAIEILAESSMAENLEELSLCGNPIGSQGLRAIAQSEPLVGIRRLYLASTEDLSEGLQALVESAVASELEVLDLSSNALGAEGALIIANASRFDALEELSLNSNGLGDQGVEYLAAAHDLVTVRRLELADNEIGDAGLTLLSVSPNFITLRELVLRDNDIGDPGMTQLAISPCLVDLRSLSIQSNRIGDVGVRHLANSPLIAHLDDLQLGDNLVADGGAIALAESSLINAWLNINLGRSAVSDLGVRSLLDRFCIDSVCSVEIDTNRVMTDEAQSSLWERTTAVHR